MTLSLTLATPLYVLQVTDRLVTETATGDPFDHISNKNVVYQARDGILTVAYSGAAYVGNRPTDQWIAELLTGGDLSPERGGFTFRAGEMPQWLDTGTCVARLREAIEGAHTGTPGMPFSLVVAGWQWNKHRRRARPIISTLDYDGRAVEEDHLPRHWHLQPWRRSRKPIFPRSTPLHIAPYVIVWLPYGNVSRAAAADLTNRLIGCHHSANAASDQLVDFVRRRSRDSLGIGEDCLSICLPHPANPRVLLTYRPAKDHQHLKIRDVDVGAPDYSPWIAGRNIVQAPSLILGNAASFSLDDFKVQQFVRPFRPRVVGDGSSLVSWQSHQIRKPAPRTP